MLVDPKWSPNHPPNSMFVLPELANCSVSHLWDSVRELLVHTSAEKKARSAPHTPFGVPRNFFHKVDLCERSRHNERLQFRA